MPRFPLSRLIFQTLHTMYIFFHQIFKMLGETVPFHQYFSQYFWYIFDFTINNDCSHFYSRAQFVQELTGPTRKFKIPYWAIKHEPDPRGGQMQKIRRRRFLNSRKRNILVTFNAIYAFNI